MNTGTSYDPETGQIVKTAASTFDLNPSMFDGLPYIDGEYAQEDFYVVAANPTPRPEMSCSVSGHVIYGIPVGAKLVINQSVYLVDDGVAEINSDQAVRLNVAVVKFPYKTFVAEVNFEDQPL